MKRFLYLHLTLVFLFTAGFVNAQRTEPITPSKDKKGIALRPSSRDYGPNHRDNSYLRIENKRNESMFIKQRPALRNGQKVKKGKKANMNKSQLLQRRQMMKQRRALRR